MLWLILFPVIGFLIVASIVWREDGDGVLTGLAGLIGLVLGGLVALLVNILTLTMTHDISYVSETHDLKSISSHSGIEGTFFLGFGSVDGTMSFSYYEEVAPDQYKLRVVDADMATVVETDTQTPHVDAIDKHSSNTWLCALRDGGGYLHYTFYVPKGSVQQDYTLKP